MLPPRRQPSFLDFSDVKIVLKIYQTSVPKSSPRGGPPIRAQDLEGVDTAGKEKSGKEKSAMENFSKSLVVALGGDTCILKTLGTVLCRPEPS